MKFKDWIKNRIQEWHGGSAGDPSSAYDTDFVANVEQPAGNPTPGFESIATDGSDKPPVNQFRKYNKKMSKKNCNCKS